MSATGVGRQVEVGRATARCLIRGREWARLHPDLAVAALARAASPWDGRFVVTSWPGGKNSTYGGTPELRGRGLEAAHTVPELGARYTTYAAELHAKGEGLCVAHGRSRWGGSTDAECIERTGIFLDADGLGGAERVLAALDAAGVAYVAQIRADAGKHHVEIPLARPLPVTSGRGKTPQTWKHSVYMPQLGWILGVLSELAGLAFEPNTGKLGYDPATDRLLTLVYVYSRRKADDPIPETVWREGKAFDWHVFLEASQFPDDADRSGSAPGQDDPAAREALARAFAKREVLVEAFRQAGLLGRDLDGEKFAVLCPWRDQHSSNTDGTSSTIVTRAGWFYCSHAHCQGRTSTDVYEALGDQGREVVDQATPPTIVLGPDEERVVDEAIVALCRRQDVYRRGNLLVHILRDAGLPVLARNRAGPAKLRPIPESNLRTFLSQSAVWMAVGRTGEPRRASAPALIASAVMEHGYYPDGRFIDAIVTSPVLRRDGSLLTTPGYDPSTGLFFEPQTEFPKIAERPDAADARAAVAALFEVVADFPFSTQAHKAAWLAAVLTPFARYAFSGPAPLFLIEANVRGAGKSLLADVSSIIATGRIAARATFSSNEEEMRKRVTTMVIEGQPLILLDNVSGVLGGSVLTAVLTGEEWEDRLLGRNAGVRLPLSTTWYATGNNVLLEGDIVRRIVNIRLDSPEERPELRFGFKHDNLKVWVIKERNRLAAAALTILRAYHAAGMPLMQVRPLGSFEEWWRLVCHAVAWVGLPDIGATVSELVERSDRESDILQGVVAGLELLDPDHQGRTVAQLIAESGRSDLLTAALAELAEPGRPPSARAVGLRLRQYYGRCCDGKVLLSRHSRVGLVWYLAPVVTALKK